MIVEASDQLTIVQLLGLTPVSFGRPTTTTDLIHPLSELRVRDIPYNKAPFYRDGEEALQAFLLLSGAVIITRFGLKGKKNFELISAPALIGGEALAGGVYDETTNMLTETCIWQEIPRSERWQLYQDPVDARTIVLASGNTNKGRKRWSDLIAEGVPDKVDFLLNYLKALSTEHRIVFLGQAALAGLIGATRESFNNALQNPTRRASHKELKDHHFFRPLKS